jgi:aromatic amino acid aminotransferase I
MFIFLAIHLDSHPSYASLATTDDPTPTPTDPDRALMEKIWRALAERKVLFAPGWGFDARGEHNIGGKGVGYLRLSFSTVTYDECRAAVRVLKEVLGEFFGVEVV